MHASGLGSNANGCKEARHLLFSYEPMKEMDYSNYFAKRFILLLDLLETDSTVYVFEMEKEVKPLNLNRILSFSSPFFPSIMKYKPETANL